MSEHGWIVEIGSKKSWRSFDIAGAFIFQCIILPFVTEVLKRKSKFKFNSTLLSDSQIFFGRCRLQIQNQPKTMPTFPSAWWMTGDGRGDRNSRNAGEEVSMDGLYVEDDEEYMLQQAIEASKRDVEQHGRRKSENDDVRKAKEASRQEYERLRRNSISRAPDPNSATSQACIPELEQQSRRKSRSGRPDPDGEVSEVKERTKITTRDDQKSRRKSHSHVATSPNSDDNVKYVEPGTRRAEERRTRGDGLSLVSSSPTNHEGGTNQGSERRSRRETRSQVTSELSNEVSDVQKVAEGNTREIERQGRRKSRSKSRSRESFPSSSQNREILQVSESDEPETQSHKRRSRVRHSEPSPRYEDDLPEAIVSETFQVFEDDHQQTLVTNPFEGEDDDLQLAIEASKREYARQVRKSSSQITDPCSSEGSSTSSGSRKSSHRHYSVSELIASLGEGENPQSLPPALERRVRDFKFAQQKRNERKGENKPWGIFGLYAHLNDIRADLEWAEDAAWRREHGEPYLSWGDFEKARDKGMSSRPWFTYSIIFLCTIMLIVTFGVNGWKVEPLNVNPLIGPSAQTLIKVGARQTSLIVNEGQWYRLFTPILLHAGLIHYIINMLATWYIGSAVEQCHGSVSAAILFLVPAVGGNILSAIFLPQYISVGASGGIFGLIGGCCADIALNWSLLFLKTTTADEDRSRHFKVLFWLFADIFLNTILGFTPFVDNFAHLGGMMYGLLCGLSTIERLAVSFFGLSSGKYSQIRNTLVRFCGLIFSVVTIMITTIVLSQSDGVTSPCSGCRYISCIPFPFHAQQKWWYCDDCDFVTADLFQSTQTHVYTSIDLNCPNHILKEVNITADGFTNRADVQKKLPTFCRQHCPDVFVSSSHHHRN